MRSEGGRFKKLSVISEEGNDSSPTDCLPQGHSWALHLKYIPRTGGVGASGRELVCRVLSLIPNMKEKTKEQERSDGEREGEEGKQGRKKEGGGREEGGRGSR